MKRIIERLKNHRDYLRSQSGLWLLMIAYGYLFSFCILLALILSFFHLDNDVKTLEWWSVILIRIILANFIVYAIARLIIGRK